MHTYPMWVYRADGQATLLKSAAQHAELEGDWRESPADFPHEHERVSDDPTDGLTAVSEPAPKRRGRPRNAA